MDAAEGALALGVPADGSTAIFAVLPDDWQLWEYWIAGFAQTLEARGFIPGFMANTDSSVNANFDRCFGRFAEVDPGTAGRCLIWATAPQAEEPEAFVPYCPSVLTPDQVALWKTGSLQYGNFTVAESWMRDETLLEKLW